MRIALVQGTRPEIIKNYPLVKAMREMGIPHEVYHTQQHHQANMCSTIYGSLNYEPTRSMGQRYQLGRCIDWLQKIYKRDRISCVIVNGDTAASLAGGLAGMYLDIPVAHVEAGLRSRDPLMYEERNRIMVDAISTFLFAYTEYECMLLKSTPDIRGQVYCEGNTTVDILREFESRYDSRPIPDEYVYVTLHRKEFTDSPERVRNVLGVLSQVATEKCQVIFPVHPRTKAAITKRELNALRSGPILLMDPLTPFESLAHVKHARTVITDSGNLQEEAYLLNTPCVTVRENTERHQTVANGANIVTGFQPLAIWRGIEWAFSLPKGSWPEIYGLPGAGTRIINRIISQVGAPHSFDRTDRRKALSSPLNQFRLNGFSHCNAESR